MTDNDFAINPDAAIESWGMTYNIGSAVRQCITGSLSVGDSERDALEKAVYYLERELALLRSFDVSEIEIE